MGNKLSSQSSIHTIHSNKFNNSCIQIVFENKYDKETITDYNFLLKLMSYCSNEYPSHRELCKKLEYLYCTELNLYNMRIGDTMLSIFSIDFINSKYCYDTFLNDVIDFFFSILLNPIFESNDYSKNFDIIKNKIKFELEEEMENPTHKAIVRSHHFFNKDIPSSHSSLGTIKRLNSINKKDLLDLYNKIVNESNCEIFVIGNLDMNEVIKEISARYNNLSRKITPKNRYIDYVKTTQKILSKEENGEYEQDTFVAVFDLTELDDYEHNYTMNVFNNIFASGGLCSKLYRYLREENSLCYNIKSLYQKYDNILSIVVGLDSKNVDRCIELINKALVEIASGNFTTEELKSAKKNIQTSIKLGKDSLTSTLNNYMFNIIDNNDLFDVKEKKYDNVTKEQVINIAKKIKPSVYYVLKGDKDGNNND